MDSIVGKKEKSADEYLAEATKHAQGNTKIENTGAVLQGAIAGGITTAVGYIGYRFIRKFKDLVHFVKKAQDEGLDLTRAAGRKGGLEDLLKDHFDKLYKRRESAGAEFSLTLKDGTTLHSHEFDMKNYEPTELGKAFEKARDSWKKWETKFNKETIRNFFKENRKQATTLIGVAVAMGAYTGFGAYKNFQKRHDQKVADNFKKALEKDNASIVNDVKEAAKDGAITIDDAREIAIKRAEKSHGLAPEALQKHYEKTVVGKHTKKYAESEKQGQLTV